MGDPDLKSEELVERVSRDAAQRGRRAPAPRPPLDFPREEPLGLRDEVVVLNEQAPLELVPSRGVLAGLRQRFKARIAMPLLMILRPVVVNQVSLLNRVVNRIDLLADRTERLAARTNELEEEMRSRRERLEERVELLHDLLEARVERLEQRTGEQERSQD